jgi:hypothetical protein
VAKKPLGWSQRPAAVLARASGHTQERLADHASSLAREVFFPVSFGIDWWDAQLFAPGGRVPDGVDQMG